MAKDDMIEVEGVVTEALPNTTFKVDIGNGHIILAHISGKLRMNFIRILPGDKVTVQMSPYDVTRGRITWRTKYDTPKGVQKTTINDRPCSGFAEGQRLATGRGHQGIHMKEVSHESKAVCEAHVREVQDHQAQGQSHGHLRKPQAQAETRLKGGTEKYGSYCWY